MQVSGYLVAFPTREHPHDSAPRGQCLGALENSLMCDVMLLPQVCVLALELVNILSYLVCFLSRVSPFHLRVIGTSFAGGFAKDTLSLFSGAFSRSST